MSEQSLPGVVGTPQMGGAGVAGGAHGAAWSSAAPGSHLHLCQAPLAS